MSEKIKVYNLILPNKPLSNLELMEAVNKLKTPNFRGTVVCDALPGKLMKKECGILNLDDSDGTGTHWVAWHKNCKQKYFFNSYGIRPQLQLIKYLKSPILCNTEQVQQRDQVFCRHLCLFILEKTEQSG